MRVAVQLFDYAANAEENLFGEHVNVMKLAISKSLGHSDLLDLSSPPKTTTEWFTITRDDPPQIYRTTEQHAHDVILKTALKMAKPALLELE